MKFINRVLEDVYKRQMPGYGLYDRALGAAYINGLWEAIEKGETRHAVK